VAAVVIAFVILMGAWGWYAWIGSVPKVAFSLRFPEAGYSGQVRCNRQGQAIFLHGGRLARHDTAAKKEVWSNLLLDKKKIADEAAEAHKLMVAARQKGIEAGVEYTDSLPALAELTGSIGQAAAAAMHLHVRGENVWISLPDKLVRFDWQSGKAAQEIPLKPGEKRLVSSGDELLLELGPQTVMRVNLVSGEARTEEARFDDAPATTPRLAAKVGTPAASLGKPTEVVRAQNLSTPARAVLPAVKAASANQQRLVNEMKGPAVAPGSGATAAIPVNAGEGRLIVSRNGVFLLSAKPMGSKLVDNDSVMVHRVTLRRVGVQQNAEWTGEMPGTPELHPLKTVDVLAAGKTLMVMDKSNQKRWEARLTQAVPAPARPGFEGETALAGDGPCVELGDTLYVHDSATLTSFDLANGSARWRFPTPNTTGLFFDDQGMIYVNGIISGGDKAQPMVTKVDSKTGKQLWRVEREGAVSYVSGRFVYTTESYVGDDDEADGIVGVNTIFHVPAYLRIKRLDPANGRLLWHHHQPRCPLDVQFDKTTIQLLFKKELQTLTFFSL